LSGTPRRKRWARRAAWLSLAGAAAIAAWWWVPRGETEASAPPTALVTQGDVADLISALGTLQPSRQVDIGAQVSGQLEKLHVKIGDMVRSGDALAQIDARVPQARLQTNEAELARLHALLAQQQAQRDLAALQAQRQQVLIAGNATSRDALETARAQLRVLDAQMAQTNSQITGQQATLRADRTTVSFARVAAPMDGTVVSIVAVEGQTLNANQTAPLLMRIADLSTMTVMAQVSEADLPRLVVGMPVRFSTLGRTDRRYESHLRQINPTPDVINNVVLYQAMFDVPNPDGALLPQMSAQVFFIRAVARNVTLVPVAALGPVRRGTDATRRTVRVMNEDGAVEERSIEIGVTDRVTAEVRSGLEVGERVVLPSARPPRAPGAAPQQRPPRL